MIRLRRLRLSQYKGLEQVDLAFPPQGSVLIEGLNEAGKSTLFDGLHFALYGRPLVGDLAEVFTYGAQRTIAYAELDVGVKGIHLIVERRLTSRAGSPGHKVQLSVQQAESGDVESVRGVRAVRETAHRRARRPHLGGAPKLVPRGAKSPRSPGNLNPAGARRGALGAPQPGPPE